MCFGKGTHRSVHVSCVCVCTVHNMCQTACVYLRTHSCVYYVLQVYMTCVHIYIHTYIHTCSIVVCTHISHIPFLEKKNKIFIYIFKKLEAYFLKNVDHIQNVDPTKKSQILDLSSSTVQVCIYIGGRYLPICCCICV